MKIWKWLLIIAVLANIGLAVFQIMPKKDKGHKEDKGEHREEAAAIELGKESQQLIGLKTIEATFALLAEKVAVTGQIAQDPDKTTHVAASQAGMLEECKTEMGRAVNKDDTLCLIRPNNGASEVLLEIKSPVEGIIVSDFAKIGDKVDSITSLHIIADMSVVPATFDVYEKDIAKVKTGQKIIVTSVAYPEKRFEGEIVFISPRVDVTTHTVKVRAKIANAEYLLKLGMFVTGEVIVESDEKYIVLPQDAVHIVGGKKIVFVKTGEHDFGVREVMVKKETKDEVAVEGIKEGEAVVTHNGFLLKSELLKSKMGEGCAE